MLKMSQVSEYVEMLKCQNMKMSKCQCQNVTMSQCHNVTMSQCHNATMPQCHNVKIVNDLSIGDNLRSYCLPYALVFKVVPKKTRRKSLFMGPVPKICSFWSFIVFLQNK